MNANAKGAIRPVGVVAVFLLLTVPLSRFLAEPAEDRAPEPVRRLDAGGRRAEEVRREEGGLKFKEDVAWSF